MHDFPFQLKAALVTVFQVPSFEEKSFTAAHRKLARHVHPDKTKPILETLYGEDRAAPFVRTFQRLQSAYEDVYALLYASLPDYVDPPSNVDAFYVRTEESMSLWIVVDAAASDRQMNEFGDASSWVLIEIPDGIGFTQGSCVVTFLFFGSCHGFRLF